ncbi:LCCL domain-containing protein, putative [Babesia ovata]|uniref:LCCL domain-containing protein, putative n=1 Tax=Babesia ovata TaxID=189622 RepID=A0A2H6KEX5_9APIC|nr:LCCL domain-containing protein, putative [Babesia ovata]GBE61548.1 LCCL domain-containing protein, putative [Babesia ovata]
MVAVLPLVAALLLCARLGGAIRYLEAPKENASAGKKATGDAIATDGSNKPTDASKDGKNPLQATTNQSDSQGVTALPAKDGAPNLPTALPPTTEGTGKKTLFGALRATADSTYKALGAAGYRKYDASNAITRGGGYWCSEANLLPDKEVSWVAELRGPRVLTGVTITWVYAPQYVAVLAKRQRDGAFEEVAPYKAVDSTETTQKIEFKRKVDAQFVKIAMKRQINGYFGIEFVQFHGEPNPVFTIQGGITSIEDLCLQADDSGEVVLDSCVSAIASFKFNDIWRYNEKRQLYNPATNLCMTLQDNVDTDGGRVMMLPCDQPPESGVNSWDLLPNNQIKLRRPGNMCLSQAGSGAGLANVALNKIASSSLPRRNDNKCNAERALDGNLQSCWASDQFTLGTVPEKVEFVVNLQEDYKVRKIVIEWESPALSYNVLGRKDDEDWHLIERVDANTLKSSVNDMRNTVVRFIKLELIRPNPEFANSAGQIHYGIHSFAAYSNKLRTIVEPCERAKLSKDARDKYFLNSVYEVDLHGGEPLIAAEKAIDTLVENIGRKIAHIETLHGKMEQCKRKQVNTLKRAQELESTFQRISNATYRFEAKLELEEQFGFEEHLPADCIEIKNRAESNPSGFYHIHPPCANHSIRVYCDMYTGASYYVTSVESGRIPLSEVYETCRKYGLDPIQLHHESQTDALRVMLKTMDVTPDCLYPIAVKVGKKFKSLDLREDVTGMVPFKTDEENNIIVIAAEGMQYVDGRENDMTGIICSSNYSSIRLPPEVVKLGCHTLLGEHDKFNEAPVGRVVKASCPQNCLQNYDDSVEVEGGNDGLYSLKTPICIAAIHAGEYGKNVTLEVQKATAPAEFEGFYQNGIQSTSVPSLVGDLAFKVTRSKDACSVHKVEPLIDRKAEALAEQEPTLTVRRPGEDKPQPARLFNQALTLDAATGEAIGTLVAQVNQQSGKSAPVFLDMFHHHTSETIAHAIHLIKSADIQREPIEEILDKLDDGVKMMQQKIEWLAARVTYKKEPLINGIKALQREEAIQKSFESWSGDGVTQSSLFETFHAVTAGELQGVPKWTVSSLSLKGASETVISQTSEFGARGSVSGAFLHLSNAQYYDFVYSASIFAGSSGTMGLTFRVLDDLNYYLLQMVQMNGGYKRLIRVVNGDPYEIAKIEDGGFVDGVRIEAQQCRISIAIVQGLEPVFDVPPSAIDIIDCTHASGSVGLFSGQINLVHFARLHVETLPCMRYDKPPTPPKPPICSVYKESFAVGFNANWRVLDNAGHWSVENNIAGQDRVIAHRAFEAIDGSIEPSMALLKGGRSCKSGIFRASMFPQCDARGVLGLLVHFGDAGNYVAFECSARACSIIQMHKGTRNVLAETDLKGIKTGIWNYVELVFKPDAITASIGEQTLEAVFINTPIPDAVHLGGTVGLLSVGCAGCAFADVSLVPNYAAHKHGAFERDLDSEPLRPEPTRGENCLAVDRLEHCKVIAPSSVGFCEANYCAVCCERKHEDAPDLQDACYKQCRNMDHVVVMLQKVADNLWRNCATHLVQRGKSGTPGESNDLRTTEQRADTDAGDEKLSIEDRVSNCQLCCDSSLFVEGVPASVNSAAQSRCRGLCRA